MGFDTDRESVDEQRAENLRVAWEKLAKTMAEHLKTRPHKVELECLAYKAQYLVDVSDWRDRPLLRVEFSGELNVIVSMYEQVQYDQLKPYLQELDRVLGWEE